jgi:putative hydrolase of the HAD superfamily
MDRRLIIFIDSGDTIIDEGTQIRDGNGIVTHAETIPGAAMTLKALYDTGYLFALVADGEEQSFTNIYQENQLGYCFRTRTISEIVGHQKPAAAMFEDAMKQNNLTGKDKSRIIMVGNNLRKDITGANNFGIRSVLLDWSPRYPMTPECPEQIPDYIIHKPSELIALAEELNQRLQLESAD